MNVFVAGGSGAIGIPLVRALVAAGHRVTALTRSTGKQGALRALGATAAAYRPSADDPALRRPLPVRHNANAASAGVVPTVHLDLVILPREVIAPGLPAVA
jgi:nucleoside-diphosphate-sugar epimerase